MRGVSEGHMAGQKGGASPFWYRNFVLPYSVASERGLLRACNVIVGLGKSEGIKDGEMRSDGKCKRNMGMQSDQNT